MNKTIRLFFIISIITIYSLLTTFTFGQDETPELYKTRNISNIAPAMLELEMRPKEIRTIPITITITNSELDYKYKIVYLSEPINSNSAILDIQQSSETSEKPDKWISIEKEGSSSFTATITIPENTLAGQYYPLVIFSPIQDNIDGVLGVNAELTTTFYINVINDFSDYKADISKFELSQKNIFSFPEKISYSLQNIGNTYIKPRGQISITAPNGEILSEKLSINNDFNTITAGNYLSQSFNMTSPKIGNLWESISKYTGKYSIKITAIVDQNQTQNTSKSIEFYYIPNETIGLAVIISLAIFIIISAYVLKRRTNPQKNQIKDLQ